MSFSKALAVIVLAAVSQPALAQRPFDVPAVDDASLAAERGTYRPSTLLTLKQLKQVQDDAARRDFGLIGSVGSIIMDDWWANDGALLIEVNRTSQQ